MYCIVYLPMRPHVYACMSNVRNVCSECNVMYACSHACM